MAKDDLIKMPWGLRLPSFEDPSSVVFYHTKTDRKSNRPSRAEQYAFTRQELQQLYAAACKAGCEPAAIENLRRLLQGE